MMKRIALARHLRASLQSAWGITWYCSAQNITRRRNDWRRGGSLGFRPEPSLISPRASGQVLLVSKVAVLVHVLMPLDSAICQPVKP